MKQQSRLAQGLWIALEMERRGLSLYNRAQRVVSDPSLLRVLYELERDEKKHYQQFSKMAASYDFSSMTKDEGELLLAQAATFFFPGGLMQAAMGGALESALSLLNEAITAEQDSIAFYTRLMEHSGEESRPVLQSIIEDEQEHLMELTERKKVLA